MQNAAHRRDSRSSKANSKKRRRERTSKHVCDVTKIHVKEQREYGVGESGEDVGKKGHRYGQRGSFEYQNLAWSVAMSY